MREELPVIAAPSTHPDGASGTTVPARAAGPTLSRRTLIQLAVASAGAVAFAGCKAPPSELSIQSRVRLAEDLVEGHDAWYATACQGCPAGCGIIVRVVAGRAKKVEGNPAHPINAGKTCARAQAVVQEQYHPDRLTTPLLRAGPRGAGAYVPISWDDALARLAEQLRGPFDQGQADAVALLTVPPSGARARLLGSFSEAAGVSWLRLDVCAEEPLRAAASERTGGSGPPAYDLANARFVLSFGADFLSGWLSPVHYARQYGIFRQGRYDLNDFAPRPATTPRGYLVQIEPRFSVTAAAADEWIWVRPGREGLLASSMARVFADDGLANPAALAPFGGSTGLANVTPENVADEVGVPAERIRSLARRFAAERPSLALAGGPAGAQTNGTANVGAVLALNALTGPLGQPVGAAPTPSPADARTPMMPWASSLTEWQLLADGLRAGNVRAVLLHEANPVYGLPSSLGFREALLGAPFITSFSSFMDETTALADLILPAHLPLEDWGATAPVTAADGSMLTLQQPVVRPIHQTRSFGDVLLDLAGRLGGPIATALPWPSIREMTRAVVREWGPRPRTSAAPGPSDPGFEQAWTRSLQQGGVWPSAPVARAGRAGSAAPDAAGSPSVAPAPANPPTGAAAGWRRPTFAGDEQAYPFHLIPFPHHTLGDGRGAHLPWLQAAPDPLTSVAWQGWVEINPAVAARYGLREGDIAGVETPAGRIDVPVYVSPAAAPDVLAVPLGQGHAAGGRWAGGRGANPLAILMPLADETTGALAYAATRARLIHTGRAMRLPKLEGAGPARQIEDAPVLRVTGEA